MRGPARPRAARESYDVVQLSTLFADTSATSELNLALLWQDLTRGRGRIVHDFFCDRRCYLLVERSRTSDGVEGRRLQILEAVLSGMRQKNIAIDFKLAPSTVALNSRLALEALGVDGKPSRAHPLLMLAARAAHETRPVLARSVPFTSSDGRELMVISVLRPDLTLAELLPAAELSVIHSLIEGLSYAQIARQRRTSTRTVANQISAVFRRLHVSGRNELVQRLFYDERRGDSATPLRAARSSYDVSAHRETIAPLTLSPVAARVVELGAQPTFGVNIAAVG